MSLTVGNWLLFPKFLKLINKLQIDPINTDLHPNPNHAIAVSKDADQYQDEDPIFIKEYLKVKEEKNGSSQRIMTIEKQKQD